MLLKVIAAFTSSCSQNLVDTHFVLLDYSDASTRHFIADRLAHVISYLKNRVLYATGPSPSFPPYDIGLGDMVRRLDTSKHSVVTEFDGPEGISGTLRRMFTDEPLGTVLSER